MTYSSIELLMALGKVYRRHGWYSTNQDAVAVFMVAKRHGVTEEEFLVEIRRRAGEEALPTYPIQPHYVFDTRGRPVNLVKPDQRPLNEQPIIVSVPSVEPSPAPINDMPVYTPVASPSVLHAESMVPLAAKAP